MSTLESLAIESCRAGMAALIGRRLRVRDIVQKGDRLDILTDADLAAQDAVLSIIRAARPDDAILSEEDVDTLGTSGHKWLVDPLDSTANYARGLPIYSVSVAVEDQEGAVAAAVGDPERDVVYSCSRGDRVVRRDGVALMPWHAADPGKALVLFGMGPRSTAQHPRTALVPAVLLGAFGKVRSPGSPALGLSWVAAGIADLAYYEMDFSDWDISAGCLLCAEAGLSVILAGPLADGLSPRLLAGVPSLVREIAGPLGLMNDKDG